MYSKEQYDHLFYRMKKSIPTSSNLFLVISVIKLYPLFLLSHSAGYTIEINELSTIHTYFKFFSLTFYVHNSFTENQLMIIFSLVLLLNIILFLWLIYYFTQATKVKKIDENYGDISSLGKEFNIFSNITFFKYILLFQFFQELNFQPLICFKKWMDFEKIKENNIFGNENFELLINNLCETHKFSIFITLCVVNFTFDIFFYWFITSRFFDFNILSEYKWNYYPSVFFSFEFLESLSQVFFILFLEYKNKTFKLIFDIYMILIFIVNGYKNFRNDMFYTADCSMTYRVAEFIRLMCYMSSIIIAIFQFSADILPNDVNIFGIIICESIFVYLILLYFHRNDTLYIKNIIVNPLNQLNEKNIYGTLIFLIKEFRSFSDVTCKFRDSNLDLFLENYVNHLKICDDYNCPCKNYVRKVSANNTLKSGYTTMINFTHMKKEEEDEYILNKFFNVLSANISPILKYSNNVNLNEVNGQRQVLIFQLRRKLIMAVKNLLSYRLEKLTNEIDRGLANQFSKETKDFIRINFFAVNILCNKSYYKTQFLYFEFLSDYFKKKGRNYSFHLISYFYLKMFAIREYSRNNMNRQVKKEHSSNVQYIDSRNVMSLCVKYYEIEDKLTKTMFQYKSLIGYFGTDNIVFDTLLGFIRKFKKEYKNITNYITHFFKNDKINNLFICTKIILFFKVIHFDIPESLHNRLIIQVHDNDEKDKIHSYIDSNYYMIINYERGEFIIKFISHELLIVLEYSESEVKDKDFHMLLPPKLQKIHKNVLINELKTRSMSSSNKEVFFVSKNQISSLYDIQYKFLLNLGGEITVLAVVNLKKGPKESKVCFACIDDGGEIIAVNKEFEDYFGITMKMLDYVQIDVEKVLLQGMGDRVKKFFKNEENIEFQENYDYDQYLTNLFEEELDMFKEKNEKEFKKVQSRWEILKELNRKRRISTKFLELNIKQRILGKKNIYFLKFDMKFNDTLRSLEPHSTTLSLIHAVKISKREMAKLSFYKGDDIYDTKPETTEKEEKMIEPQDDLFESQSQISSAVTELKERNSVRLFRHKGSSFNFSHRSRNIFYLMISIGVLAFVSIVYNILTILIKVDMYNRTHKFLNMNINTVFFKKNIYLLSSAISFITLIEDKILQYSPNIDLPLNFLDNLKSTIETETEIINNAIYTIGFISSQYYKKDIDGLLNKQETLNYIFDNGYIYQKSNISIYQEVINIKKMASDTLNKYEEGTLIPIEDYTDSIMYKFLFFNKINDYQDTISTEGISLSNQDMNNYFLLRNLFNQIPIYLDQVIESSSNILDKTQKKTVYLIISLKVLEFVIVVIIIIIEWVFLWIGYEKAKKKIVRVIQKVERNNIKVTLKKINEFDIFANTFSINSLYFIADLDLKKIEESSKTLEGSSSFLLKPGHSLYPTTPQNKKKSQSSLFFSAQGFGNLIKSGSSLKKEPKDSFVKVDLSDGDRASTENDGKKNLLKVMHKLDQIKGIKKSKDNLIKITKDPGLQSHNENPNSLVNDSSKPIGGLQDNSELNNMFDKNLNNNSKKKNVPLGNDSIVEDLNVAPIKPALRGKEKKRNSVFDEDEFNQVVVIGLSGEEESKAGMLKGDEGLGLQKKRTTKVQFKEKNVRYYSPGQNVNEIVDLAKQKGEKRDSVVLEKPNFNSIETAQQNLPVRYKEQKPAEERTYMDYKSSSSTFLTNHANDNEKSLLHVINSTNKALEKKGKYDSQRFTNKASSSRELPTQIQWSNLQDNSNHYSKYHLLEQGNSIVVKKPPEREKDIPKKEVIESKIENVVYNNIVARLILNITLGAFVILYVVNILLNFIYQHNINQASIYSNLLFNKTTHLIMIMLRYEFMMIENENADFVTYLIEAAEKNKKDINDFEVNKKPNVLPSVFQLEKELEANDSCTLLSEQFSSYYNSSYEDELKECSNVGELMNSNGIKKAESYVLSTLIFLIEDWKKLSNKNEDIIVEKLNDFSFLNIVCEIEYTLRKYSTILMVNIGKDAEQIFLSINKNEKLLGFFSIGMNVIFLVLSLIFIIYPIRAVEMMITWLSHKIIVSP